MTSKAARPVSVEAWQVYAQPKMSKDSLFRVQGFAVESISWQQEYVTMDSILHISCQSARLFGVHAATVFFDVGCTL